MKIIKLFFACDNLHNELISWLDFEKHGVVKEWMHLIPAENVSFEASNKKW